jgi:hypothetical protein
MAGNLTTPRPPTWTVDEPLEALEDMLDGRTRMLTVADGSA